ncbi:MAG: SBBP repeat-containing protein [Chitinophagales bacterium]|nr:SBBP repeat-containing protein [Chitinophagales bacterium]
MPTKIKFAACLFYLLVLQQAVSAQPSAEWVFHYNGEGDYTDRFTCMASDAAGNIYAGGSSVNIGTDRDFLVQKSDADGNIIWRTMTGAAGNGPDEVTAIWVDGSQNVYVTGFGKSQDAGNDFLTIKYDPNGVLTWSAVYNYDVANAYDQPNSIALDQEGNVIVTGQSDSDPGPLTKDDYLTIKYSSTGSQVWIQRYNGLGDGTDRAVKVVTDNNNNIYVTGRSYNGSFDDYVTIKYNAAGTQQWLKYGDRNFTDRATAMAIDANANIYVTGWSSNGSNDDFYTIKYNSSGATQWSKVVDGVDQDRALAIAVDGSGNVYVSGSSDGDNGPFVNLNYRTVKYNANGVLQWNVVYDGTAGNDDIPSAIAVAGNEVFVTGTSDINATPAISNDLVTIKYASGGTVQWTKSYAGTGGFDDVSYALLANAGGNTFVAGYEEDNQQQRNALLIKYDNSGTQLFSSNFNGTGDNSDNIRDLKTDVSGNLYLAGYAVQRGQNRDFFILKLTATGDTAWTRYINGSSPDSEDEGQSITIDGTDHLIAAGFTKNSGSSGDFTAVKLDAAGDSTWLRYFDSPTHENDKAYDMQRDATGNIYITGRTDSDAGLNSNDDATTIKYDTDGNLLWSQSYNGTGNGPDRGSFVRVAASGNIYVGGRTFNGSNLDMLFIKYSSDGNQQWIKSIDGGFGNDEIRAMAIDNNENIYVTGSSAGATDSADLITMKYSPSGDQLWLNRYNGNGNGGDFGEGLAVDPAGNVLVTGYTDADNTAAVNLDILTIKYDGSGTELWNKTANGSVNLDAIADAIITDEFGNAYVAGHGNNGSATDLNFDIITIRYNDDGTEAWQTSYNGVSDTLDEPNTMLLSGNDLFIAGSSWQNGQQRDMIVIKYASVTGIRSIAQNEAVNVFPNPFTDVLHIQSPGLSNAELIFQLFDVTGRLICTTAVKGNDSVLLPGKLAPGCYTYAILNNRLTIQAGKLIH